MNELIKIRESNSEKYTPRTYYNASSCDVTLALAVDLTTAGERCTHKAAGDKYIGFQLIQGETNAIEVARDLYKFMKSRDAKTINIAGNGIYSLAAHGVSQKHANYFLYQVLKPIHEHLGIEMIRSGGQTGIDIAGAVVANYLKIPAEITLPKGYIQRHEDKIDRQFSKKQIEDQIDKWTNVLVGDLVVNKNNLIF